MADLKISQLVELENVTGEEYVPVSINGTNKKMKVGKINTSAEGSITNDEIDSLFG